MTGDFEVPVGSVDDVLGPRALTRHPPDRAAYTVQWRHPTWYVEVYRLWRLGLNDGEIARTLGNKNPNQVWIARNGMGLAANAKAGERSFPNLGRDDPEGEQP